MNTKLFKNHHSGALKTLTGFVLLGGALYGATLSPAYSQPTPPTPPVGAVANDGLRPIAGKAEVDPQGRLLAPPADGPGEDAPPPHPGDRGPRDDKGPRGPRDDRGPRRPADGPRGERELRGPDGPGRPGGPDADKGPRKDGPRGPQGALERAHRSAGELERYGQLQGDVFNLTGQARDYYNRAGAALKAGNQSEAEKLARTSEQLADAALHLARAQDGPLPQPKVVGWDAPPTPVAPAPPVGEERKEPRPLADLTRRLGDVTVTPTNSSWVETARRLAAKSAGENTDAGRERSMAALKLLEAADSLNPPQPPQAR